MRKTSNSSNEAALTSGLHYRGRLEQVRIYLGKLLRMFIYQNDWKVLPMAALVAGMVHPSAAHKYDSAACVQLFADRQAGVPGI